MHYSPSVSVVVATCNRASLLPEALVSLLGQTHAPDQVLVVDDGSSDTTPQVLRAFGGRIESMRTSNGGKARALNLALQRVTGDYVWMFDDDDIALPHALERHLVLLRTQPGLDLTYSAMCVDRPGLPRMDIELPEVAPGDLFRALLPKNFLLLQGMLVRSDFLLQVGTFAEDLIRAQDYDMILRLTRHAVAARVPGPPTFVYRQHEGRRGLGSRQFEMAERNRVWLEYDRVLFRRLMPRVELWELVPGAHAEGTLSRIERRHGLMRRLSAFVRRDLWEEALSDLRKALEASDQALEPAEIALWESAFDDSYGSRTGLRRFLRDRRLAGRIARLSTGPAGRDLCSILARRLLGLARWLTRQRSADPSAAHIEMDARRLQAQPQQVSVSKADAFGNPNSQTLSGGHSGEQNQRRQGH